MHNNLKQCRWSLESYNKARVGATPFLQWFRSHGPGLKLNFCNANQLLHHG